MDPKRHRPISALVANNTATTAVTAKNMAAILAAISFRLPFAVVRRRLS